MLAVGHQVEVVGELDGLGELLQGVDAEAFTAELSVGFRVTHDTVGRDKHTHTIIVLCLQPMPDCFEEQAMPGCLR